MPVSERLGLYVMGVYWFCVAPEPLQVVVLACGF